MTVAGMGSVGQRITSVVDIAGKERGIMAKRILVSLDGTAESKHVLPIVEDLARGAGATVRFLHVTPWPETVQAVDGRVMAYADQRVAGLTTQSENYLDQVAKRFRGVSTERAVRFGEAAEEILEEAAAWPADLVVILEPGGAASTEQRPTATHLRTPGCCNGARQGF